MSESFILYTSYYALIEGLTDEQLGQLTRAIFLYTRDGRVIELDPVVRMAFVFIKDNIERNQDKYQAKCEKNRQIALERERKKREAREKLENTNVHERSRTCKKNTNVHERSPYEYDNEYVNDSDNDVSNETVIEEVPKVTSMPSPEVRDVGAAVEPKVSSSVKSQKKPRKPKDEEIDYVAIKDYWNDRHDKTGSAMRRVTLMTDNRKEAIRGRLRECKGDISKIYEAIDKAMASSYLNSGQSWASYDWVMTRKYFSRVLEGNYDDRPQQPAPQQPQPLETGRQTIGERYEQAKHQQGDTEQEGHRRDSKYRTVIGMMLEDLRKNPANKPARQSLARYYEVGVLQRLGIDWKP